MEIKTRNGFIYNANDLVHSRIREQIKLAALQNREEGTVQREPRAVIRAGSPVPLGSGENFYVARV